MCLKELASFQAAVPLFTTLYWETWFSLDGSVFVEVESGKESASCTLATTGPAIHVIQSNLSISLPFESMFSRLRALVQSLLKMLEVFPLAAEVFGQVLSVIPLFQGVATSPVYIGVYYCNVMICPLLSFHWRQSSAQGPEKQRPWLKINTLVSFIDGLICWQMSSGISIWWQYGKKCRIQRRRNELKSCTS